MRSRRHRADYSRRERKFLLGAPPLKLSQPILWLLTAVLGGALPLASQGASFPVDQCAADRYGQSLNCTANDLEFAKDAEILSVDGVPAPPPA